MRAVNIKWVIDEEDMFDFELPSSVNIPDGLSDDDDAISDYITDSIGFCHKGFELIK